MNYVKVPLQGYQDDTAYEYLDKVNNHPQHSNEPSLLNSIRSALRGADATAPHKIEQTWYADDENPEGRQLTWNRKQVALSVGGVIVKRWSFFEDRENIQAACLGVLEQNAAESKKWSATSSSYSSVADDETNDDVSGHGRPVFGPFGAREQRPRKFPDEHELIPAVFVFFRSVARIYLQNGTDYIVSIPFVVRRAWPISPHGVMVQRVLDPTELAEAAAADEEVLATLFTITSPLAEPSVVGLAASITGGVDIKPLKLECNDEALSSIPPTESVIWVSQGNSEKLYHRKSLVVTVDPYLRTRSIWRYAYAKPNQEAEPPTTPSVKKRQSLGPHNHNRRVSAAFEADRLDSRHQAPSKDPPTVTAGDLAAMGAAASMGVAAAAAGIATSEEHLDALADTMPQVNERMKANYWMELVHREEISQESVNNRSTIEVAIWDERWDGTYLKSHLGIVCRRRQAISIYRVIYDESLKVSVQLECEYPACSVAPVLSTRPKIYDAVIVDPDGALFLLGHGVSKVGFGIYDPINPHPKEFQSPGVPKSEHGLIRGVTDARGSLVQLWYADGWRERINLDFCPKDTLVLECLQILSFVIPALECFRLHMDFINNWCRVRRVIDSELQFVCFKASLYRCLGIEDDTHPPSKTHWEDICNDIKTSRFYEDPALRKLKLPPRRQVPRPKKFPENRRPNALHSAIMFTLHVLAEDLRLLKDRHVAVVRLAPLVARLALVVRPEWADYWKRLVPDAFTGWPHRGQYNLAQVDDRLPIWPQDITALIYGMLSGTCESERPWSSPLQIAQKFGSRPAFAHDTFDPMADLHELLSLYAILADVKGTTSQKRAELAIDKLVNGDGTGRGIGVEKLDWLPFGVAAPIREALRTCQLAPPATWPLPSYSQLGRNDLAASASEEPEKMFTEGYRSAKDFMNPSKPRQSINSILSGVKTAAKGELETVSGVELGQEDFTQIRFGQDRRLEEVARLLNSSTAHAIKVAERSDQNEHEQTREYQTHVLKVAERTLALPFGRAMFTFGSVQQVTREAHTIPKIEYSIRVIPSNITVQPEAGKILPDAVQWGEFHNGVAAGLRIGPLAKGVESSWITFNKPSELTPEHAGFLFALGLTGHLKGLMTWHTFQYLTPKHDQTSIAILLGLAASNIGMGTQKVVKLLAVHTPALLPTPEVDLNVSLITQASGLSGLGLLYLGMRNRRMADVCLSEMSRRDLVQPDLSNEHREAYTFSAAIAFGMIMLGKGSNVPADLDLLERLNTLIHGHVTTNGRMRDRPMNPFDINLTSPAAAIALGLFYLKTERQDVADMLEIPDTSIALNRIQPSFLMIRTIARALIMWDKVQPTVEWMRAQIPENVRNAVDPFKGKGGEDAFELAWYNIMAGCCFVVGLKYAGTARQEAYAVIVAHYDLYCKLAFAQNSPAYDLKIKRAAVRDGLNQISLALSMVMAGTGEISCLRRVRFAYGAFQSGMYHPNFRYGVHLATVQSLGLLFLGAGRYTLGTSDAAIACMVAAFFPRPHVSPSDNKSYLQALRHLWVLAVEPRCLIARDVDTGEVVYLPVKITVKEGDVTGTSQLVSPTLIPDISKIQSIRVDTPRYWPFYLDVANAPRHRDALLRNQTLYVKRRTAFLSYTEDPRGSRSLFVRSGSSAGDVAVLDFPNAAAEGSGMRAGNDLEGFITSFSNNVIFLAWADHLCRLDDIEDDHPHPAGKVSRRPKKKPTKIDNERIFHLYCHAALLDCILQDKPETLQTHLSLLRYRLSLDLSHKGPNVPSSKFFNLMIQDLRFASDFYSKVYDRKFSGRSENNERPALVRDTAVSGALHDLKEGLEKWRSGEDCQRSGDFFDTLGRYARGEPVNVGEVITSDRELNTAIPNPMDTDRMLTWYLLHNGVPTSSVLEILRILGGPIFDENQKFVNNMPPWKGAGGAVGRGPLSRSQLLAISPAVKEMAHLTGSKMTNTPWTGWSFRSLNEVITAWNVPGSAKP